MVVGIFSAPFSYVSTDCCYEKLFHNEDMAYGVSYGHPEKKIRIKDKKDSSAWQDPKEKAYFPMAWEVLLGHAKATLGASLIALHMNLNLFDNNHQHHPLKVSPISCGLASSWQPKTAPCRTDTCSNSPGKLIFMTFLEVNISPHFDHQLVLTFSGKQLRRSAPELECSSVMWLFRFSFAMNSK